MTEQQQAELLEALQTRLRFIRTIIVEQTAQEGCTLTQIAKAIENGCNAVRQSFIFTQQEEKLFFLASGWIRTKVADSTLLTAHDVATSLADYLAEEIRNLTNVSHEGGAG